LDRAARVVFESGRPIAHVARDLGLPSGTLRKYVRQVEADEGRRPDLRSRFAVEPICRTLGVSASAHYQRATGHRS
jgi:transposase-like protein